MAIKTSISFEGTTYNLDNKDRVAAAAAQQSPLFTKSLTTATYSVSAAESGTIFLFNRAAGVVVTLPTAAVGLNYEFYVETALTSNAYTINAASTSDTLTGMLMSWDIADVGTMTKMNESVATVAWSNPAAADHQLVTNKTTTGGLKGSYYRYRCVSSALWHVSGYNFCSSGATLATPFT
tara:strand:- start:1561 stop:2100 length:540 start_codon:yes stop_codon:yes gene_type:complete